MKLVVDASVLFAIIISKGRELRGKVLDIFFHENVDLFAPMHLFSELAEHEERIRTASGFLKTDFDAFLAVLSLRIKPVLEAEIEQYLPEAMKLSPDPDDAPYLAAALSLNCTVWSDDPHFKKQPKIRVYSTRELSRLLFA
ncbi:MAG: PIN domain-containing protein [Candidatus Aenigmarchaeota archaeon]|nr:PIN domain-containing protein [Candidatus Aenigmarchaeota archaeon]